LTPAAAPKPQSDDEVEEVEEEVGKPRRLLVTPTREGVSTVCPTNEVSSVAVGFETKKVPLFLGKNPQPTNEGKNNAKNPYSIPHPATIPWMS